MNVNRSNERKWSHTKKDKEQTIFHRNYHRYRLVLLANTPAHAKYLLHSLEQAARFISLYMNSDKVEFMSFKQDGAISTFSEKPVKFIDYFTYISRNISSTESRINIDIRKPWIAVEW